MTIQAQAVRIDAGLSNEPAGGAAHLENGLVHGCHDIAGGRSVTACEIAARASNAYNVCGESPVRGVNVVTWEYMWDETEWNTSSSTSSRPG